jgi:hypothetical protein
MGTTGLIHNNGGRAGVPEATGFSAGADVVPAGSRKAGGNWERRRGVSGHLGGVVENCTALGGRTEAVLVNFLQSDPFGLPNSGECLVASARWR